MMLREWDRLPQELQTEAVRPYYKVLHKKKLGLIIKRCFDVVVSLTMLIVLLPLFLILALLIKADSSGAVFFRQIRVTQYGRKFSILKFRTMVSNAEQLGTQVTTDADPRITHIGHTLRKYRLDEVPQLLNILIGDMSFVGTRPEVPKYVEQYTDEMMATLLLPAGVTSAASIAYKDEMQLLINSDDADEAYVQQVLPEKMRYNFMGIVKFSFCEDIKILFKTVTKIFCFKNADRKS